MQSNSLRIAASRSAARAHIARVGWGILAVVLPAASGAQTTLSSSHRTYATRTDLEAAAVVAERVARTSPDKKERERKDREARVIRERLRDGDFQPGHRIYLNVQTDSALSDTLTVRSDRKLLLPGLPEMSLVGVLDSELQPYLTKEISRYIKNPTVRATGLLRLQISGSVGHPGFFSVTTDAPITDAIMLAGGPSQTADLRSVKVRRGDAVALDANVMGEAIREGLTVSEIGMRPGDELEVGDKSSGGWATTGTILKASLALVFPIVYLLRRF